MQDLSSASVTCPYCWESLEILLDPSDAGEEYIEDCQVCCRPILLRLSADGGTVDARREDD